MPEGRKLPLSPSEREAHRALLQDALSDLATAPDPEKAASEVMRALDAYIEATGAGSGLSPRELPVADFQRRDPADGRWVMWVVLGCAVLATGVVAVTLSGGWPAGLAILAIWVAALFALATA